MQYEPQDMADDIAAMAVLSAYTPGTGEWIEACKNLLEAIHLRMETRMFFVEPDPEPEPPTLEQQIAEHLGIQTDFIPEPVQSKPPSPKRQDPPGPVERDLSPENLARSGVVVNAHRAKMEAELEAKIAAGETPTRINPPGDNMGARAAHASISPALCDPHTGQPWLNPSV